MLSLIFFSPQTQSHKKKKHPSFNPLFSSLLYSFVYVQFYPVPLSITTAGLSNALIFFPFLFCFFTFVCFVLDTTQRKKNLFFLIEKPQNRILTGKCKLSVYFLSIPIVIMIPKCTKKIILFLYPGGNILKLLLISVPLWRLDEKIKKKSSFISSKICFSFCFIIFIKKVQIKLPNIICK